MMNRRECMQLALAAGMSSAVAPVRAQADRPAAALIQRTIPSSGQQIPAVGLGSSATFSQVASSQDVDALREVLSALVDNGGTVFDTAPAYGASEQVAGELAHAAGITDRIFWATKVNVAGRGRSADAAAARAQIDNSFKRIGKPVIDLIQVHNLGDMPTQLAVLRELKQAGRIRHLGATSTSPYQHDELIEIMRREPLDFIGVDYAIDNRDVEKTILPLARDRGIAVMVCVPFGRSRLWQRVRGHEVPGWAAEFDASSWAQFFLKFILAHPAVTVITPATSRARHMIDNLGGAVGRLPDAAMRRRMVEHIASLPARS